MKQVFLSGQGQVDVVEAPVPGRANGCVLVRSAYSLISAGTEGAAVTKNGGVKGLYEKVMNSRGRAGQVWDMVQSQGLTQTVDLIRHKLDDQNPVGYSLAGVVLETGGEDTGFRPGQRVACMGTGFANHAEFAVVPKNLTVALPDNVEFDQAAFAAIACIAMQGIRRLELSPGERIAVVGLGLIGQVALRLATAMGYQAFGFDIDDRRVARARQYSNARAVFDSESSNPVAAIDEATGGAGVDGVVICASARVDGIINQAFDICRCRGRVSVVGDIGLGLQRAKMYAKELEVRLSCSYGVGRYDPDYELGGHDYPLPHVRWTERRNLEYFLELLSRGHLDLSDLVSAKIDIDDAKNAYSLIKSNDPDIYGVLLDYRLPEKPELPDHAFVCRYEEPVAGNRGKVRVGLVGVGSYAKAVHVPNIQKLDTMQIRGVASKSGGSAAVVAKKVNAAYASSDVGELLADGQLDAVVISTRHASHARLVLDALAAGKHVFVEKPMATTVADCLKIIAAQQRAKRVVRVGYNRRFAPCLQQMKAAVGEGRKLFNVRVNVGAIGGHWSNTADEGGRLMGEGVHFFDLANWMMGCAPESVTANFLGGKSADEVDPLNPDASISIRYKDGSVANIAYTTVGHTGRGKEYFELFGNGRTVVVDDYRQISGYGCKASASRKDKGNKGQAGAMAEFAQAIVDGDSDVGADTVAGLWATAIAAAAVASAEQGRRIDLAVFIAEQSESNEGQSEGLGPTGS